uniref:CinA domain-containing protein n=1 Tax=Steinernema glaseri TaxID=37863 RepID=A0A1I7YW47_9BILA
MALGALRDSGANVVIATTGVAGPAPESGVPPGTMCFAWAFAGEPVAVFTRTQRFFEDMSMQQRVWRFERVGWYLLVIVVLLALAGLFGNGPLSDAEVVSQDGRVKVEYQRLSRSGTTDNLYITVQGEPGQPVK